MNRELLQLVSDTLTHIKETSFISLPPPVIAESPPPKPLQSQEPKAIVKVPAPQKPPPQILIYDKIKKHLPHIKLIQEIPKPYQVAVVAFHQGDLAFLKNLAKAIQEHFCTVKLLDGNKISSSEDWKQFHLVITQKKLVADKQILLETIATYQNNTQQKKLLWSTICQHLSPKLS